MAELDRRRSGWTPPVRPDWVARINEEGRCLDLDAVVPLDEESLLQAARERTGLADFDDRTEWRESFSIFVKSLREEANLNLMGRLITRSDLVNMLTARLQIREAYRQHPEIDAEQVATPLMIIGQPRTGTSLLLNVLSQDPDNGSLRHWECMYPCPPPEKASYLSDPRIEMADAQVEMWNRINPDLVRCHEFNARVPTEASHAMTLNFAGAGYLSLLGQTPTHVQYQQQQGVLPGLRYMRQLLKLLQWKNPRKRWILKAPDAILYMPELLEVFPDMKFIWTHRDPLKAADSTVHMYGSCMWIRSDTPIMPGVSEQMINADHAAQLLAKPINWMKSGAIPRERVFDIRFFELERDPVRIVAELYSYFDIELTQTAAEAMGQYMIDNPRSARPPPNYALNTSPEVAAEREALKFYEEYAQVPREF